MESDRFLEVRTMALLLFLFFILFSAPISANEKTQEKAEQFLKLANSHLEKAEYQKALNNYSEALKLFEQVQSQKGIAEKRVYGNMKENRTDKAAAVTKAKLQMIEEGPYSHPYYWAPFVLIGKS
jgi:outer membrane protein assembly factor BamD (BamD/ComL family)